MRIVAKNMTDALVKIDSNGKDYYQANYRKLDAELAAFADSLRFNICFRGQDIPSILLFFSIVCYNT